MADETHFEIKICRLRTRHLLRFQPTSAADFRPRNLRGNCFHQLNISTDLLAKQAGGVRHVSKDPWHIAKRRAGIEVATLSLVTLQHASQRVLGKDQLGLFLQDVNHAIELFDQQLENLPRDAVKPGFPLSFLVLARLEVRAIVTGLTIKWSDAANALSSMFPEWVLHVRR